jgi:hypothetical protein
MRAPVLATVLTVLACPAHAAIEQLAQAGGPDPNLHLFQLYESQRTPSAGTQQFVGWIGCTYPAGSADAKTYCNGPHDSQFASIQGLTGLGCQSWQLTSSMLVTGGVSPGACEPVGGTWNYAGQCYPYIAENIPLADCAESKFYCQDTTFFGAKLTANCCPGSSNPGAGKCF